MKTDWYLKIVLTVIAIALTILVLQNIHIIPTAKAKNNIMNSNEIIEVRIIDWQAQNNINVNIDEVGGWYVSNGALKVTTD